ncbi:MAG: TetR/AcrR family transcriptional regulator [Rhodospirillales bacterium]|nr:TetR/AcrR family transcriptional regulator [Rhodospirillales bacterium]
MAVNAKAVVGDGRGDNRMNLLDAAAARFSAQGYAGTSMRDIAADVGIKAGSIYYHFEAKSELLVAVHEEGIRRITRSVEQAINSAQPPRQRLQAAMIAHLQEILNGGDYAQVVLRELLPVDDPRHQRFRQARNGYEDIFRRLIDDLGISSATKRRHLRLLLLGALNWSPMWYRAGGQQPAEIAAGFLELVQTGCEQGRDADE